MIWPCAVALYATTSWLSHVAERRAGVWTEIAAINERSVRTIHVHENVDISEPDGTFKEYASRDVRFNEYGNARIEGSRWAVGAMDGTIFHHVERFQILDGVFRAADIEQGIGVAFTAESRFTSLRDEPNILVSLGRFRPTSTLCNRAELFARSLSLRLVQEDADRVVMQVTERLSTQNRSPFVVRVEMSPRTADVLSMEIVDTKWGHLTAKYSMGEWTPVGTARLPLQVIYEQFDLSVPREVKKRVEDAANRAGLGREDRFADGPRYREWVAMRDAEIPPPAPSRVYPGVMRAKARIEAVNAPHDASWLAFPPQTRLSFPERRAQLPHGFV